MGLIRDMIIAAAEEVALEAARGAVSLAADAADGVSKGVRRVSELTAKINAPITKKKIEKLRKECDDLYLLSVGRQHEGKSIQFYTADIDLCLMLVNDGKSTVNYKLLGLNGGVMAEIKRKKRLFKEHLSIITSDGFEHIFYEASHFESKTRFEFDKQMKIIRNNILSDYEFYAFGKKVAILKHKPAVGVEYALQVLDNRHDFLIILMAIGLIIF